MVKIYVCHHPPLKHRKEKLEKVFSSRNIKVEWVEKFSPEEIVEDYDQIVGVKDIIINPNVPGVQQNQYTLYENAGRQVTIPELSLTSFVFNIDESLSNSGLNFVNNNDFQVELFPNPAEDQLNLILPDYSNYNIKIFNLQSQKLIDRFSNNKEVLIDISTLENGTYLLNIKSTLNQKTITKKIIKQ